MVYPDSPSVPSLNRTVSLSFIKGARKSNVLFLMKMHMPTEFDADLTRDGGGDSKVQTKQNSSNYSRITARQRFKIK